MKESLDNREPMLTYDRELDQLHHQIEKILDDPEKIKLIAYLLSLQESPDYLQSPQVLESMLSDQGNVFKLYPKLPKTIPMDYQIAYQEYNTAVKEFQSFLKTTTVLVGDRVSEMQYLRAIYKFCQKQYAENSSRFGAQLYRGMYSSRLERFLYVH